MISSLTIDPIQKDLYFQALNIMEDSEIERMYLNLTRFVEKIEMKELNQIQKESFSTISWMRKKEAEEKLEELNGFSFLLHNI